ncbi:MAG: hypothetical protein FD137_2068 [Spirochaetes bacterium]|nr:MAG: hypothetical protein FD137_2068 [Spirochaetota bacterium]
MNGIIDSLRQASTTVQALAITVGGLVGVFLTLGFFYFLICLANRTAK